LGLPFEDLVQEGHLGLIKAIERFDIAKGFRFSTYAHIVISQSIHLALDKQLAMVRLPFKALREKASVEKTRQVLEQQLGRAPHIHELVRHLPDELEYKDTHIANMIEPNANSQMLYASPEDAELLAAHPLAEEELLTGSLAHRDLVETMLERLNARESYIVRLRYGIGMGKEFTLEEISMAMGLSRERVRQLAHQAVEKLGRIYDISRL
jgi:RNA polymerase sigma factor (sigma-70 family)